MEIKRFIRVAIAVTGILGFAACKKDNLDTNTNQPVVQAYLVAGQPITVKLYQQKDLSDTSTYGQPITGQQLTISDGTNKVQLTESSKGVYTYADNTFLVAGKTYSLSFTYASYAVSASTVMPSKPENFATQYASVTYTPPSSPSVIPDTINRFTWSNPDSLNHILVFKNADGTAFALNNRGFNVNANFEVNTDQKSVYYCVPNAFPYYGHYTVTLLRVNQEYINVIKSNAFRTTSQNLLNTPTNVKNGFGIFTAMQADSLKFDLL